MKRGDVVLVYVPFVGAPGGKLRPGVVVQADDLTRVLRETVIVEVTSNLSHAAKPHQVFVVVNTPDGVATGLLTDSAIRCERLHAIPQSGVMRTIGRLSDSLVGQMNTAIRSALALS